MNLADKALGLLPLVLLPADGGFIEILPPVFADGEEAFFLQPGQKGEDGGGLPARFPQPLGEPGGGHHPSVFPDEGHDFHFRIRHFHFFAAPSKQPSLAVQVLFYKT